MNLRPLLVLVAVSGGCGANKGLVPPALPPTSAAPVIAHAEQAQTAAYAVHVGKATKVRTIDGITEYQLDNGLQLLLFPDPTQSTITVNVTYKVGSRVEGYGETGMAHLLEHMMFKGSPNHREISKLLEARGGQSNGSTEYDRTNYFETLPASQENLDWTLDLEAVRQPELGDTGLLADLGRGGGGRHRRAHRR